MWVIAGGRFRLRMRSWKFTVPFVTSASRIRKSKHRLHGQAQPRVDGRGYQGREQRKLLRIGAHAASLAMLSKKRLMLGMAHASLVVSFGRVGCSTFAIPLGIARNCPTPT